MLWCWSNGRPISAWPTTHHASDTALKAAIKQAFLQHQVFLSQWLNHAPQTNEVARSAALIPAAMWLSGFYAMPLTLSELGASAGLNLGLDRFALAASTQVFGPKKPVLRLAPDWYGPVPTGVCPEIADRRGVDLNPLDLTRYQDALRLQAYLWPDQPDRMARTRAAFANQHAKVDRGMQLTGGNTGYNNLRMDAFI